MPGRRLRGVKIAVRLETIVINPYSSKIIGRGMVLGLEQIIQFYTEL